GNGGGAEAAAAPLGIDFGVLSPGERLPGTEEDLVDGLLVAAGFGPVSVVENGPESGDADRGRRVVPQRELIAGRGVVGGALDRGPRRAPRRGAGHEGRAPGAGRVTHDAGTGEAGARGDRRR